MTQLIDTPQTLDLLAHVVNTKGEDYKVEDCIYFASDLSTDQVMDGENERMDLTGHVDLTAPCCIVGHVFHLIEFDFSLPDNFDTGIEAVHNIDEAFTTEAQEILAEVQKAQDRGDPWGEVLHMAKQDAIQRGLV